LNTSRLQFRRRHQRQSKIFDVNELSRQRRHHAPSDERLLGEHSLNDLGRQLRTPLGILSRLFRQSLPAGGDDAQLRRGAGLLDNLKLQHFDAVESEVQADGLNL
jgi:hypothetical protein